MSKHPMQYTEHARGALRFRTNEIVRFLLDAGPFGLNDLAKIPFSDDDRRQFAQLIGYSVDGYNELSYAATGEAP